VFVVNDVFTQEMMQSTISQSRVTLIYRNIRKIEKEKGEKEERKKERNPTLQSKVNKKIKTKLIYC
jgi:hypothetical protein